MANDVEDGDAAPTSWWRCPSGAADARSDHVKYMLLIYNNPAVYESWSEEDRNRIFSSVDELMTELQASGEWVGGEALVDASLTKTVRVRDGVPLVTDGPFVEAKEQFAGYLAVDCVSIDRAVEIAARWPDAAHFAMEVRPFVEHDPAS